MANREEKFIPVFPTAFFQFFFFATVTFLHIFKLEELNLRGSNFVKQFSVYI